MGTLVIFAPTSKAQLEGKRSFRETIAQKIGEGYAISSEEYNQIKPGWKVIVQDVEERKQAEGKLVRLDRLPDSEKTRTGMWRYDICMDQLTEMPYEFISVPSSKKAQRYRGILVA